MGTAIPYLTFLAMKDDLDLIRRGDGRNADGRPFGIYRYQSRTTGKIYDEVAPNYDGGDPQVAEYPKPE